MAKAVVSVAFETFCDLLLEEGSFLSGVGDEVKALQTQLKEMMFLLEDADRRRHESKSVSNWIAEIKDLAYRAEDVIDTYAADAEASSKRGRGLKKLLRGFSCIMKEFHSLHQIGSEISKIKSDLAGVGKSMQDCGIRSIIQGESSSTNDNQQWKRQTFPNIPVKDCFVGKTTITRKVYNHIDTKRHFQSFAWVCITQQCQIGFGDCVEAAKPTEKRDVVSSLSNTELIEELCQIQKVKRCIIVHDDLWETDNWDGLKHAFLVQGLRSKILVTTRKQSVVEIRFPIQLRLLSKEGGWE